MRGQIVLEFLLIAGIAMLVGALYLAAGANLLSGESEEQRISALNNIGYMVQDELILAGIVEDGYQRSFIIPMKADRFAYTLSNDETMLTLRSGGAVINYPLPRMSGTLQQGENIVRKDGNITVNS